jgi:hypothetical protein
MEYDTGLLCFFLLPSTKQIFLQFPKKRQKQINLKKPNQRNFSAESLAGSDSNMNSLPQG